MSSDDLIWRVIGNAFCSFKFKSPTQNFCKNENNVSGLCEKQSCPLSNSQYATVREIKGRLYLFVKTVERQHFPDRQWEKILLSRRLSKAIEQVNKELEFWPEFLRLKCKERVVRINEYLNNLRINKQQKDRFRLVVKKQKLLRREKVREKKAEIRAQLEQEIEKELLNRLNNNKYGETRPLNCQKKVWDMVLKKQAMNKNLSADKMKGFAEELISDTEEDEREFVEALSSSDNEGIEDMEDIMNDKREVEYENENMEPQKEEALINK